MTERLCAIYRNMLRKVSEFDAVIGGTSTLFDDEMTDILALICESLAVNFDDYVYDVMYDYSRDILTVDECIRRLKEPEVRGK